MLTCVCGLSIQNTEAGGLQVQGQSGPYIITLKMLTIPTLSDTKTRQHTNIQAIHQYTDDHRCEDLECSPTAHYYSD